MALSRSVAALVAVAASLQVCAASQAAGADRSEILAADRDASCGAVSALQRDAGRRAGAAGAVGAGAAGAAVQSIGDEAQAQASARLVATAVVEQMSRRFRAGNATEEMALKVATLVASIRENEGLPASDPFWEKAKSTVLEVSYSMPDTHEWMDYDKQKDYVSFNKKSCDPAADGSKLDPSVKDKKVAFDAWYCGRADLDWSSLGGKPEADLCSATVGKAKDPDGLCGSVGTKQLLINLISRGPAQWPTNSALINVPSIDCLMDIGDGDIYYCQQCSGRCTIEA